MKVRSFEEARRLRDEAIARGQVNADRKFMYAVDATIYYLATTLDEFTTDDLWEHLAEAEVAIPAETRSIGGAMRRAQGNGWISPTPKFIASERPVAHCKPIRVWQSRIVEP